MAFAPGRGERSGSRAVARGSGSVARRFSDQGFGKCRVPIARLIAAIGLEPSQAVSMRGSVAPPLRSLDGHGVWL